MDQKEIEEKFIQVIGMSADLANILMDMMNDLDPPPDLEVQRMGSGMAFMTMCMVGSNHLTIDEMVALLREMHSMYLKGKMRNLQ